jgi:ribosomal protein S18 acetylase RimI-like enzyme
VDPLDNPVWHSIVGDLSHLAETSPDAQPRAGRFLASVSPFAALDDEASHDAWGALADLVGPAGVAVLFRPPIEVPPGWTTTARLDGLQMLGDAVEGGPADGLVSLGPADTPEMLDLVRRAEPGPFETRTVEMGHYLGLRRDGVLVAMAGERFRFPGRIEVSAVCTDPDHRGQGLARRLVGAVVSGIREQGAEPVLHVAAHNQTAVGLYESMGFETRGPAIAIVLQAPDPTNGSAVR